MATTLLMAHYWILHKHCQPEPPPPPVFFFSPSFYNSLPLVLPLWSIVGAFFYLSMRCWWLCLGGGGATNAIPSGPTEARQPSTWQPFQYPHTPFGFETAPGEKSSDTSHSEWGGGGRGYGEGGGRMWSHLIVESLYSEWWQSALWLCCVHWALRLKPYTGKAPPVPTSLQPSQPPLADLGLSNVLIFTRKKSALGRAREMAAESFWRWPRASSLPPLKTRQLRNRSERLGRLTRGPIDSCRLLIAN